MSQQEFTWPDVAGTEFSASDEEVNARIHEVANEHDTPVEDVVEDVKFILDAGGSGFGTAEGVGPSTAVNPDNESDSRLEALKIWKQRQYL